MKDSIIRDGFIYTFPDGDLGYNCRTCNGKCCRGYGFLATRSELINITQIAPEMAIHVKRKNGTNEYALVNGPQNCQFLSQDNLCSIQLNGGWPSKPITCKLFPANLIEDFDKFILVSLNPLCPVYVT